MTMKALTERYKVPEKYIYVLNKVPDKKNKKRWETMI